MGIYHGPFRQTFTVVNTGNVAKTFKLSHIPAGTMLTLQPVGLFKPCLSNSAHTLFQGTSFPADQPIPLSSAAASVTFSETTFTVRPGQTQKLTAHFSPPPSSAVSPSLLPVISGFIEITNTDSSAAESYHITYLGVAASLKKAQVVDNTDAFFGEKIPAIGNSEGNFITGPTNFTFVSDDFPTLVVRLDFGTPQLRVDLVDPNIRLNTTLSRRASTHVFERESFSFPGVSNPGTFSQVKIIGPLFEFDFIPRNSDVNVSCLLSYRFGTSANFN